MGLVTNAFGARVQHLNITKLVRKLRFNNYYSNKNAEEISFLKQLKYYFRMQPYVILHVVLCAMLYVDTI